MDSSEHDVEGIDLEPASKRASDYPLDDVMVRSETRTVSEIVKRIDRGRYVMNPDFQRDFVWSKEKQSKLIESCVMRIPLPVLYVAEADDGRVTVVDGLQRLSTFLAFTTGRLRLTGLGREHPLEGKTIEQLPINLRERIEDTQLTLYILDKNAPEAARLDIFERVNSGVPLTRQQMRNALYNGHATHWLAGMSREDEFLKATGGSLQSLTMRDREAINRFCAFYILGWKSYTTGDMDEFLAKALRAMNQPGFDLSDLRSRFLRSMKRNQMLFGRHAFRKSLVYEKDDASRSVINIALFDVLSVGLARVRSEVMQRERGVLKSEVLKIMQDEQFVHCITFSTNSTSQVRDRFKIMFRAIERFFV
ncbi:DUF262 domain-containing protein [Bradyrhizobium sp. HKCCYLS2033]|uniref:DUF262 domain-containing protein n=1 Tax=Bradyrhizobium TaxID=374 RepID=UPI003EBA4C5C